VWKLFRFRNKLWGNYVQQSVLYRIKTLKLAHIPQWLGIKHEKEWKCIETNRRKSVNREKQSISNRQSNSSTIPKIAFFRPQRIDNLTAVRFRRQPSSDPRSYLYTTFSPSLTWPYIYFRTIFFFYFRTIFFLRKTSRVTPIKATWRIRTTPWGICCNRLAVSYWRRRFPSTNYKTARRSSSATSIGPKRRRPCRSLALPAFCPEPLLRRRDPSRVCRPWARRRSSDVFAKSKTWFGLSCGLTENRTR